MAETNSALPCCLLLKENYQLLTPNTSDTCNKDGGEGKGHLLIGIMEA